MNEARREINSNLHFPLRKEENATIILFLGISLIPCCYLFVNAFCLISRPTRKYHSSDRRFSRPLQRISLIAHYDAVASHNRGSVDRRTGGKRSRLSMSGTDEGEGRRGDVARDRSFLITGASSSSR